jgi:hypothetical protein
MTTSSYSHISVPHTGGWLELKVRIPNVAELTPDEAKFIDAITEQVYGRLRDMIGERAAARLSEYEQPELEDPDDSK